MTSSGLVIVGKMRWLDGAVVRQSVVMDSTPGFLKVVTLHFHCAIEHEVQKKRTTCS